MKINTFTIDTNLYYVIFFDLKIFSVSYKNSYNPSMCS